METTPTRSELILESPLRAEIVKVSRNVPSQVQWRSYTIALLTSDFLAIGFAFWLAYIVRFELSLGILYQNLRTNLAYYQGLVIFLIPTWLLIFYLLRLYDRQKLLGGTGRPRVSNLATY